MCALHVCVHVMCVCAYVHVCIGVCVHMRMYACMCVRAHVCVSVCWHEMENTECVHSLVY